MTTATDGRVRIRRTGEVRVPLDAASALALFTPEGERTWIEGWAPRYPEGGEPSLEEGTVFETDKGEATATWVVVRYAPDEGRATYAYVLPGQWATLVDVCVTAAGPSWSRVAVGYHMTSLAPGADSAVRAFGTAFPEMLSEWQNKLAPLPAAGVPAQT